MTDTTKNLQANKQQLNRTKINAFLKANSGFDFKTFNFFDRTAAASLKWGKGQQEALLPQLKALQRLIRLMPGQMEPETSLETAEKLYKNGLHAALQIASMQKQRFVKEYASYFPTDLSQSQAEQASLAYQKALARKTKSVMTYAAISQHTAAHYQASRFNNLASGTEDNFNGVPSYEDLFGGLDFCTCEHCRSIFSPAAYFVDLMRIQAKYIDQDTLAFPLEERRKDLWDLVLNCSNTNTLVPTIKIVNEVLYANSGMPTPEEGDSQDQVYQPFDTEVYPFNLPFNLPLEKIRQYLLPGKSTLTKVWADLIPADQLASAQPALDMEALGVSPAQWNLYSTPDSSQDSLNKAYGLSDSSDPVTTLASVDTFLLQTGLTHDLLYALLFEDINDKGINSEDQPTRENAKKSMYAEQVNFFINIGSDKPVELDNGIEKLKNLNTTNLDHIHRFVRLAQVMGWSFTDLDWALYTSGQLTADKVTVLDNNILPYLGWIKGIQNQQPTLSVNQICSYIGSMKDRKTQNDGPSFFDSVYNAPDVPNPPAWQNSNTGAYDLTWDVPDLSEGPSSSTALDQQIQSAMAAALQLSQNELVTVGNLVLDYQVFIGKTTDRTINLTLPTLSVFYRFSQLPVLTGLSLDECLVALTLAVPSETLYDNTQSGEVISWLILYAKWIQSTAMSTYQVQYFLTGESEDATIQNQILGDDAILNFQDNFLKIMKMNLITETQFGDTLGDVLKESEYSPQAATVVYGDLVKNEYIQDGKVTALPNLAKMESITVDVFPTGTKDENANVASLSKAIIAILTQYLNEPLSQDTFVAVSQKDFVAYMVADDLLENIWLALKESAYIENADNTPQLVLRPSVKHEVQEVIAPVLFPHILERQLSEIARLVTCTLNHYYELQQNTLNQSLGGLLDITPPLCAVIEVWEGLSLGDVTTTQATTRPITGENNCHATIPLIQAILYAEASGSESWENLTQRIQLLQVYAVFAKALSLSTAKARNILYHPDFYGVNYQEGNTTNIAFQFSLENIQTLEFFRKFVLTLKDTQNHFLDYLNYAAVNTQNIDSVAQRLSQLTRWNQNELEFLITDLWPGSFDGEVPPWATVAGIEQLSRWFRMSKETNLDTNTLWRVYLLPFLKTSTAAELLLFYEACSEIATAAWSGLTADELKAGFLQNLDATILTIIRDATLDYVMNYLRNKPGSEIPITLTNTRDLYNYLLIDVEVGATVETSYIKSAISSVQLFIHRCRNNLEPGVVIDGAEAVVDISDKLNEWWDWMAQYRVWEANRKVFLYPENYIQPELYNQKTPLFAQLEDELKQGDLRNPVTVETAFQNYLDGFAEVANLEIIGSAGYDVVDKRKKVICLVGRTSYVPYHYYYRTVTLIKDPDLTNPRYIPVKWDPWYKVDMNIEAIGPVKPVFAFGKWFLFWVQEQQTGEDEDTKAKLYQATCYYTYLNFNQNWVAPLIIGEPVPMKSGIEEMYSTNAAAVPYWNQVYPVYFNTTETIVIPYGKNDPPGAVQVFTYDGGNLRDGLIDMFRYAAATPIPNTSVGFDDYLTDNINYGYWNIYGTEMQQINENGEKSNIFSFSTWLYINEYPDDIGTIVDFKSTITIDDYDFIRWPLKLDITNSGAIRISIVVEYRYTLYTPSNLLETDKWQQLTLRTRAHQKINMYNTGNSIFSNLFNYQGNLYLLWIANSNLMLKQVDTVKSSSAEGFITLVEDVYSDGKACLFEFQNELYVSWMTAANMDGSTWLGKVNLQSSKVDDPVPINGVTTDSIPGFSELNDQLYLTWKNTGDGSNNLTVATVIVTTGIVSNLTTVTQPNGAGILCDQSPTMLPYQGNLLLCWIAPDNGMYASVYDPALTSTLPYKLSDYKAEYTPNISSSINGEVFMTWPGALNYQPYNSWFTIEQASDGIYTISTTNSRSEIIIYSTKVNCSPGLTILDDQIFISLDKQTQTDSIHIDALSQVSLYLNGEIAYILAPYYSLKLEDATRLNGLYLGKDNKGLNAIDGSMQEALVYNRTLGLDEVALLYKNSVHRITRDYDVIENVAGQEYFAENPSMISSGLPVMNQPASLCLLGSGISLLGNFYYQGTTALLDCYRLNTTAFNQLSQTLFIQGIGAMLDVPSQESEEIPFEILGPNPNLIPITTWPSNTIDFNWGATREYYWEIFFFNPFLIAYSLENDQQFERAATWYQYIFNPTINERNFDLEPQDLDENDKYWRFLGLRSYNNPVVRHELSLTWAQETEEDLTSIPQLYVYHNDPFDPHAIARLRPIAYQKTMVMHYIKNMLNWGDHLFRQYTVESIVEANMLYVMAYDLLGNQPLNLGPCPLPEAEDLDSLLEDMGDIPLSSMPEFLIQTENRFGPVAAITTGDTPNNYIPGLYFGLPENDQFIAYWDLVQNRLYNIRNGLNIDGVPQELPLFEPAINPADLVQQIASGQCVNTALALLQVPIPYYRFDVMIQKVKMFVQSVTQFGQSLLITLEKKNAESLSLLQSRHQQNILGLTTGTRQAQLDAAKETLEALQYSLQNAQDRYNYYNKLLTRGLSTGEEAQIALEKSATALMTAAQPIKTLAAISYLLPNTFGLANGGMQFGHATQQTTNILEGTASTLNMSAGLAGTIAGYQRRAEDWELQKQLAQDDMDQINSQILAAQYQVQSAQEEVAILQKNIDQEQEIDQFLKNKFTNEQLYQWMSGQLSSLYFQAYELAHNLALQAEKSWQFERGKQESFIQPNYWNSLYEGLTSGEALQLDLERMEATYMQQNERRLEIQKIISLAALDLAAFTNLKDNGECIFDITELDFDYDYPGHYCRQIKSMTLSFPALLGPYQNIHATLTQTGNKTLLIPDSEGVEYLLEGGDQPDASVLRVDTRANQQVALSQGINDSGLFEVNFNDERYLPFEGTGAISSWKLDMPKDFNRIDFDNLTDVIIQLNYTAIPGNGDFKDEVIGKIHEKMAAVTPLASAGIPNETSTVASGNHHGKSGRNPGKGSKKP